MPRPKKDPADKRVQVSVKIRYFLDATAAGYSDIGDYIAALQTKTKKLQDAINAHIGAVKEIKEGNK